MAYRFDSGVRSGRDQGFIIMELIGTKGGEASGEGRAELLLVDGSHETLILVQECLAEIVGNALRARRLAERREREQTAGAELFTRNLAPLLQKAPESAAGGILGSLSLPLKKALLKLAMDCFDNDRESASRALGISRDRLEQEMRACGLAGAKKRA